MLLGHAAGVDDPAPAKSCAAALDRFTAAGVPEVWPDETASPAGKRAGGVTPANLPGNGLAQHPMLYVGEGY